MVFFWWGAQYVVDAYYPFGVFPFPCCGYRYFLLSLCSVKEILRVFPRLELVLLLAPLPFIIVKNCHFGE